VLGNGALRKGELLHYVTTLAGSPGGQYVQYGDPCRVALCLGIAGQPVLLLREFVCFTCSHIPIAILR
jgi:hypothetical protein